MPLVSNCSSLVYGGSRSVSSKAALTFRHYHVADAHFMVSGMVINVFAFVFYLPDMVDYYMRAFVLG